MPECNFYFLVLSAPVAFGPNVYDRWARPCLPCLVGSLPSVVLRAAVRRGVGPVGMCVGKGLCLQPLFSCCPQGLMLPSWAHLLPNISLCCQVIVPQIECLTASRLVGMGHSSQMSAHITTTFTDSLFRDTVLKDFLIIFCSSL